MVYKSPRKVAEDLERRARVVSERTRQKERFSHMPYKEMQEWYKKSFDKYRHAGDMWAKAGNSKKAIQMYEGAIKFAPSEQVGEKINEKIRSLYSGRGKLERNLYASVSIISLVASLFFISFNVTGNSIGNLSKGNLSLLGIGLFALGLIAFIFFKSRKK